MSKFERLHLHVYRDEFQTQNKLSFYEKSYLEGIMIHTSFKNVSASLGNNSFYYEAASSVVLPDGYYDLSNLNKILKGLGTGFYKLILADDTQTYKLWKFAGET